MPNQPGGKQIEPVRNNEEHSVIAAHKGYRGSYSNSQTPDMKDRVDNMYIPIFVLDNAL